MKDVQLLHGGSEGYICLDPSHQFRCRRLEPAHHFSQSRDDLSQGGQRLVDVGTLLCGEKGGRDVGQHPKPLDLA